MNSPADIIIVGLVMTFAAALVTWILLRSSRMTYRRHATEVVSGTVRAVTEPFARSSRGAGKRKTVFATLVLLDNGGTPGLPASIPLDSLSIRIGRDLHLVNVVLDDPRISRLHCRIGEEDGQFRVLDEGSTSGTYLNDVEIGLNGAILQDGDILSIGPIDYRYVVAENSPSI